MHNISAIFGPGIIGFYSVIFVGAALLYRAVPAAHKKLGGAVLLSLFSIAGLLSVKLMGGASAGGFPKLAELVSRLLAVIAGINVAGVFGFSLVMPKLRTEVSKFVQDLILAAAYALAGLAVISASGANLSGVLATSALVTGVVAFSLQDTLGNIIGGMVLHLESSFRPGDWIRVEEFEGVIREIRWRQATLETLLGDVVVVPNIILMKSPVTVLGRALGGTRFRAVSFPVYYDSAPGEVASAVIKALKDDPPEGVASYPEPDCVVKDFQPNAAIYEARYFLTDFFSPGGTDSKVRARVFYALSRAGIKLSVPSRAIIVSEGAREVAEKSSQAEQARRRAALDGVYMFKALTEQERSLLARRLKPTPFLKGEQMTRQGAVADWLYIIYEGSAEVRLYSGAGGPYKTVKTLGSGDFLGEMGLLTGEPRSATVVAADETRCYRLDREGFREILTSRPEIAEAIASMLAKRRVELDAAKEKLADEAASSGYKAEEQNLLSRIKYFFKI